jgi:hypothetical protein
VPIHFEIFCRLAPGILMPLYLALYKGIHSPAQFIRIRIASKTAMRRMRSELLFHLKNAKPFVNFPTTRRAIHAARFSTDRG